MLVITMTELATSSGQQETTGPGSSDIQTTGLLRNEEYK